MKRESKPRHASKGRSTNGTYTLRHAKSEPIKR